MEKATNNINMPSGKFVFISYSSRNQQSADLLREWLKKNSIASWMAPYDIPPGSSYAGVIEEAVRNCGAFLLVLTIASQDSKHVTREVDRAITYEKTIIPVKLENVELNADFSYYLSTTQIVAVSKLRESASELKALLVRIKSILGSDNKDTMRTEFEDTKLKPRNERKSKSFFVTTFGRLLSGNSKGEASKREKTADRQQTAIKDNKISISDFSGLDDILIRFNESTTIENKMLLERAEKLFVSICKQQHGSLNYIEFGIDINNDFVVKEGVLLKYVGCSNIVVIPRDIKAIKTEAFKNTKATVKALIVLADEVRIERHALFSHRDIQTGEYISDLELVMINGIDECGDNPMQKMRCCVINDVRNNDVLNGFFDNKCKALRFFFVANAKKIETIPNALQKLIATNDVIIKLNGN